MKLRIRAAKFEDAELIREWANDVTVRTNSFHSEPILLKEHLKWYGEKLNSPETRIWILESYQTPVAQVRYERIDLDVAEVNYSTASDHRNRGFGTAILKKTTEMAYRELGVRILTGAVFITNIASIRTFQKAGFIDTGQKTIKNKDCNVFIATRSDSYIMTDRRQRIEINNRRIGSGEPVYIVAEMSANHCQDFDRAVRILHAAKEAGADAVKLQTYTPDTMTIDCNEEPFRIVRDSAWAGKTLYELYGDAMTPWEWQPRLKEIAEGLGLDLFSTPFDHSSVTFLEKMNVPAYKIASFEIVDLSLIERVAKTNKSMIISTGMATLREIREAVNTARSAGATQIVLLKCTSAYPAPPEEMNLRTISALSREFGIPVGLSDHGFGIIVPVAAVAMGACMIEKHLTLSRDSGSDAAFSLIPSEFKSMVAAVRMAERALGTVHYGPCRCEAGSRMFRRSLFVVKDMKTGDVFTADNLRVIRPGYGLSVRYLKDVLNKRASRDVSRGSPLMLDMVETVGG